MSIHRGATLEYLARVPEDYRDGAVYPLLVWLHGFGADMHDLASVAAALPAGYLHVLPNAPLGGFSGPEGTVRAWFERGGKETPESVQRALIGLDAFMQEVRARFGVPSGRALLIGFSQGANLALRFGLPRPELFAGLAALSCSLRQPDPLLADLPSERGQPIFLAHGVEDGMVPVEGSRRLHAFLTEQRYRPKYQEYPMGHAINEQLLADLTRWVVQVLPPRS